MKLERMKMPKAEDIRDDSRFVGLFIGRSGSGKSAAAYSFPKPMKIFDLDGRIRGGLVPWIDRKDIDFEYFPPYTGEGETVFNKLNEQFKLLLIQCRSGLCKYKTLVLDSITHETISFLLDAIPLTHTKGKGRHIGPLMMGGPQDYGFQSTGTHQVLAFLKSLPIPNIIVTAHTVNKWGKPPGSDEYTENVIIGEQLALTDKLAEAIPTYFDHIFKFEKADSRNFLKFFFSAHGDIARTPYPIPYGLHEITGKDFYKVLTNFISPSMAKLADATDLKSVSDKI